MLTDVDDGAEFQPYKDDVGYIVESAEDYCQRMKQVLPQWPDEVLREWLHRHADNISDYASLDFQTFSFELQGWSLESIPGREAFLEPGFCDSFSSRPNLTWRAEQGQWLAKYMIEHGTWNTPIVLLHHPKRIYQDKDGWLLQSPFHFLEGHKRLAYLNALRASGEAKAEHAVWLVHKG